MIRTDTHQQVSIQLRFVPAIYIVMLLLGLMANAVTAHAQQDIRLSTEPLSMVLPDYAKIQSAARIGDKTLVVWGTTRRISDTHAVSMLVVQMLHDRTPIGIPQTLTTPDARPYDFVQVLPLRDRFLVVWNDMRGGDSVAFMQRVDSVGVLVQNEEIYNGEPIDSYGIAQLGIVSGYRLVWNRSTNSSSRIMWREIDSIAAVPGPTQGPIPGVLQGIIPLPSPSGAVVLQRQGTTPILHQSDVSFDVPRGEVYRHFTIPYFIDTDGSLVNVEGTNVKFYRTVFDTVAYRTLPTPIKSKPTGGIWIITRDTVGKLMLIWTSGSTGYFTETEPSDHLLVFAHIYGSALTPADTFEAPKVVKTLLLSMVYYRDTELREYIGSSYVRSCDNQHRVEVRFENKYYTDDSILTLHDSYIFNVDNSGRIAGITGWDRKDTLFILPINSHCPTQTSDNATRNPSKLASEISVHGASTIHLSAPAAYAYANIPQLTPCIARHASTLSVSWYSLATDSLYSLGQWNTTAAVPIDSITAINYNELPGTSNPIIGLTGTGSLTQLGNTFLISSLLSWREKAQPGDSLVTHRQYLLHTPTDTGWRLVKRIESPHSVANPFTVYKYGYNPVDGTIIGTIGSGLTADGKISVRAFAVDSSRYSIWDYDSLFSAYRGWWISTVPISGNEFIFFNASTGIHYHGRDKVRMLDLPGPGAHDYPVYSKLLDNSFIRAPMSGRNSLELYNLDGNNLASGFLDAPTTHYDLTWLQNPADSGFVVLWGSDTGVWMSWLDKQLNMIRSNIPISEQVAPARHPVAVFRKDTLFVVWEDYRNGVSDIYGTSMHLKTLLGVESQQTAIESVQTMSVAPNPARDVVTISIPNAGDITLSVIDNYGTTRLRSVRHASDMALDIRSLPTGTYRIVVLSKGKQYSIPLSVIR
jgi:hypothetical protein